MLRPRLFRTHASSSDLKQGPSDLQPDVLPSELQCIYNVFVYLFIFNLIHVFICYNLIWENCKTEKHNKMQKNWAISAAVD